MKIRQVIVVREKRYAESETMAGRGYDRNRRYRIGREDAAANPGDGKDTGVIIFTDPDTPGDQIRQRVNQRCRVVLTRF